MKRRRGTKAKILVRDEQGRRMFIVEARNITLARWCIPQLKRELFAKPGFEGATAEVMR